MTDFLKAARRFLEGRAGSYRRVFMPADQDAQDVLADLAKFCRAHESTGHVDSHVAARLDGRREVWLRIQNHLRLTDDQLWALHGGPEARRANRSITVNAPGDPT